MITFNLNCIGPDCSLQIEVQNQIANPTGAGQLISGIAFGASDVSSLGAASLSNTISNDGGSGQVTIVDFDNGNSQTSTTPSQWQFSLNGTVGFYLNDLTGGQPKDMIIGGDGDQSSYTNANASITSSHNPSLLGAVFFTISNFGTPNTTFNNVEVQFGTGDHFGDIMVNTTDPGGPILPPVPEPMSLLLVGSGLGLAGVRRIARNRKPL